MLINDIILDIILVTVSSQIPREDVEKQMKGGAFKTYDFDHVEIKFGFNDLKN